MRCLSLTQPWASLIANGVKRIETRSWGTAYRGALAIHAAKSIDREACRNFGYDFTSLPRGCVLCTCQLVECFQFNSETVAEFIETREFECGDFEFGRWGWRLREVKSLPVPVPAIGHLGLWEWTVEV